MSWRLAEAKNNLDEVVARALTEGPQRIHHRGQVVVVLSETDYQRLTGEQVTLKEYLLSGPDLDELDLSRDEHPMREIAW